MCVYATGSVAESNTYDAKSNIVKRHFDASLDKMTSQNSQKDAVEKRSYYGYFKHRRIDVVEMLIIHLRLCHRDSSLGQDH